MTWGNPPKLEPTKAKAGKKITPQNIAKDSEHSHQSALFAWAALSVGKYPQLRWMFAIPNGGLRDIRTATNLKAEGVKAGVPDIFLPVPLWTYTIPSEDNPTGKHMIRKAGLFIEMKVGKNKTSKEQKNWIATLSGNGYYCAVCYSWEEARETIIAYLENKV